MSNGHTVKVSKCCKAALEWSGGVFDGFWKCSECGRGRWPDGVQTDFVYHPSDYEKQLESRISSLEREFSILQAHLTEIGGRL